MSRSYMASSLTFDKMTIGIIQFIAWLQDNFVTQSNVISNIGWSHLSRPSLLNKTLKRSSFNFGNRTLYMGSYFQRGLISQKWALINDSNLSSCYLWIVLHHGSFTGPFMLTLLSNLTNLKKNVFTKTWSIYKTEFSNRANYFDF